MRKTFTTLPKRNVMTYIAVCYKILFDLGDVQLNTSEEFMINGTTGEHTYEFTGFEVWSYTLIAREMKT